MIARFRVKNFKPLEDVDLEFKKLNILVGPNNSGKTSFIQALALLKQSAVIGSLSLNNSLVSLVRFEDVVFKHELSRDIEMSFSMPLKDKISVIEEIIKHTPFTQFVLTEVNYDLALSSSTGATIEYISGKLTDADRELLFKYDSKTGVQSVSPKFEGFRVSLYLFLCYLAGGESKTVSVSSRFSEIMVSKFREQLYYLKSLRGITSRQEKVMEHGGRYARLPGDVGVRGENTIAVLAFIRDDLRYRNVMKKIDAWATRFGFENVLSRLVEGPAYALNLMDRTLGLQTNIVDVGFGANSLLPVIVQCFYAPIGSMVMIEQPEVYMHPKMQAMLADLFLDVISYGNQLIIETHSEHLLLRLQTRIAEGKANPKDIAIYYFEGTEKGTKITKMELDETGRFKEPLPEGFFEEGFKEALEHLRAMIPKGRGQGSDG